MFLCACACKCLCVHACMHMCVCVCVCVRARALCSGALPLFLIPLSLHPTPPFLLPPPPPTTPCFCPPTLFSIFRLISSFARTSCQPGPNEPNYKSLENKVFEFEFSVLSVPPPFMPGQQTTMETQDSCGYLGISQQAANYHGNPRQLWLPWNLPAGSKLPWKPKTAVVTLESPSRQQTTMDTQDSCGYLGISQQAANYHGHPRQLWLPWNLPAGSKLPWKPKTAVVTLESPSRQQTTMETQDSCGYLGISQQAANYHGNPRQLWLPWNLPAARGTQGSWVGCLCCPRCRWRLWRTAYTCEDYRCTTHQTGHKCDL